jgi:PHD/YefM family antitoxin component YafN of YafNO toxin-antitoxin module
MGTPKVKSATSLRSDLYETLKEVSGGEPHIITHKQGDPVLLVSKEQYDELVDQSNALRKMAIGLSQIESGEGISHKKAIQKLRALKSKWK